jgi:hypothetical protein
MTSGNQQPGTLMRSLLLALSLLLPFAVSAAPDDVSQLMALLAERRDGHVRFVEQHFVALLDRPVESSGELFYTAPDKLEKRTLQPQPESMVIDKGILKIRMGRRQRTVNLQGYPELAAFIESIRATLAGDLAALRRYFRVEFNGTVARWELELVPEDARLLRAIRQVRIEGAQDDLQRIEVLQADGDRSVMSIMPIQ